MVLYDRHYTDSILYTYLIFLVTTLRVLVIGILFENRPSATYPLRPFLLSLESDCCLRTDAADFALLACLDNIH